MRIPIPNILLILLVCISTTTTTSPISESSDYRGPFRTSYVFMTVQNTRTGERVKSCVNYQQYLREDTPSSLIGYDFDSAHSFLLKFWEGYYNRTKICPLPPPTSPQLSYGNGIVPLEYRIDDDGTPCTKPFVEAQTSFRNASQFTPFQVDTLKQHGAGASLLIMDRGKPFVNAWKDYLFSDFYDPYINSSGAIPTFYIYRSDLINKVLTIANPNDTFDDFIEIRFHRPTGGPFDPSFAIIWLISMTCVGGGGFWAFNRHRAGKDVSTTSQHEDSSSTNESDKKGFFETYAGIITIALMMLTLCGVLLLGYFFRPILVIFFNIFLVIFGTCSLYGCIRGFFSNFAFSEYRWYKAKIQCSPTCCVTGRVNKYQYSEIFITLVCFAFCATWFIVRRQPYAFILLDIINIALCMHVLKCLRLPSLKWISILMLCMFVYDAAMVFGTPYITPNGCSVMLEVATGLACSTKEKVKGYPIPPVEQESVPEKFPMLMQVAHFNPMNECFDMEVELGFQFTILGLGDIVMPGYLVAHCFTMNGFSENVRLIYGIVSVIGYGVGLVVTFVALAVMKTAQPALIYLVPSTLIPIIILAVFRGEFSKIWNGVPVESVPLIAQSNADEMVEIESEELTKSNSNSQNHQPVNV